MTWLGWGRIFIRTGTLNSTTEELSPPPGELMRFVYDDGGQAAAGRRGEAGHCVIRSVAIASGRPYAEIYAALSAGAESERRGILAVRCWLARLFGFEWVPRFGVHRRWFREYMRSLDFKWVPFRWGDCGTHPHLVDAGSLPTGQLVVQLPAHCTAVINGVIHDTCDPQDVTFPFRMAWYKKKLYARLCHRCVRGYWILQEPPVSAVK